MPTHMQSWNACEVFMHTRTGALLLSARYTAGSAGVDVQPSPCHVEGLFISIGWFIMKNVTNLEVSFSAVSRPMFVGQVLNSK